MDLKITGSVKQILGLQTGESKNGPWKKQDFILETPGKFPRLVCVTQWGDQIDKNNIQQGETVTAHIDIQSREYNGKWYTDVKAWKVEKGDAQSSQSEQSEESNDIDFGPIDDDEMPF